MVFLASVTPLDGFHWLTSAGFSLFNWLVLTPLVLAILISVAHEILAMMVSDGHNVLMALLGLAAFTQAPEPEPEMPPKEQQGGLIPEVFPDGGDILFQTQCTSEPETSMHCYAMKFGQLCCSWIERDGGAKPVAPLVNPMPIH